MFERLPDVARWLAVDEATLRGILASSEVLDLEDVESLGAIALDARLRAVVALMHTVDVRIGRALRLFSERRLERELGWFDLESYVQERLGIGLRKARSLIALDRAAAEVPPLRAAYEAGSISWVRALAILPVVRDAAGAALWVERAREVIVRRIVDEVAWALEKKAADGAPAASPPRLGSPLEPVQMRVDGGDAKADHIIEFWGPASVVSTLERLSIACSEPGEPPWKGLVRLLASVAREWQAEARRRTIPRKEARILERDGYRCIVPCCSSRRNLQVHHLIFRSAGGGDEDWNRGTLCAAHHHQCLHRFTVVASGRAPDAVKWVFGSAEPDGPLMRLDGEAYERDSSLPG